METGEFDGNLELRELRRDRDEWKESNHEWKVRAEKAEAENRDLRGAEGRCRVASAEWERWEKAAGEWMNEAEKLRAEVAKLNPVAEAARVVSRTPTTAAERDVASAERDAAWKALYQALDALDIHRALAASRGDRNHRGGPSMTLAEAQVALEKAARRIRRTPCLCVICAFYHTQLHAAILVLDAALVAEAERCPTCGDPACDGTGKAKGVADAER